MQLRLRGCKTPLPYAFKVNTIFFKFTIIFGTFPSEFFALRFVELAALFVSLAYLYVKIMRFYVNIFIFGISRTSTMPIQQPYELLFGNDKKQTHVLVNFSRFQRFSHFTHYTHLVGVLRPRVRGSHSYFVQHLSLTVVTSTPSFDKYFLKGSKILSNFLA